VQNGLGLSDSPVGVYTQAGWNRRIEFEYPQVRYLLNGKAGNHCLTVNSKTRLAAKAKLYKGVMNV